MLHAQIKMTNVLAGRTLASVRRTQRIWYQIAANPAKVRTKRYK